jgi:hypothetical protein
MQRILQNIQEVRLLVKEFKEAALFSEAEAEVVGQMGAVFIMWTKKMGQE